jgi:hypothetical protein
LSTKKKKERPLSFINWHSLGFILEIEELFVAQVLIKKVKLKCCGI